jgi:hypothetical protein
VNYPGKYNAAIRKELTIKSSKLFICGHSYFESDVSIKTKFLLCESGAAGVWFHQSNDVAVQIIGDKIQNLELLSWEIEVGFFIFCKGTSKF